MATHEFYNVQYSPEFADALGAAPDYRKAEFVGETGFGCTWSYNVPLSTAICIK